LNERVCITAAPAGMVVNLAAFATVGYACDSDGIDFQAEFDARREEEEKRITAEEEEARQEFLRRVDRILESRSTPTAGSELPHPLVAVLPSLASPEIDGCWPRN
jgi:hypothetical protein